MPNDCCIREGKGREGKGMYGKSPEAMCLMIVSLGKGRGGNVRQVSRSYVPNDCFIREGKGRECTASLQKLCA